MITIVLDKNINKTNNPNIFAALMQLKKDYDVDIINFNEIDYDVSVNKKMVLISDQEDLCREWSIKRGKALNVSYGKPKSLITPERLIISNNDEYKDVLVFIKKCIHLY